MKCLWGLQRLCNYDFIKHQMKRRCSRSSLLQMTRSWQTQVTQTTLSTTVISLSLEMNSWPLPRRVLKHHTVRSSLIKNVPSLNINIGVSMIQIVSQHTPIGGRVKSIAHECVNLSFMRSWVRIFGLSKTFVSQIIFIRNFYRFIVIEIRVRANSFLVPYKT